MYWILKLHKCPYKQLYIVGPDKSLSKIVTSILRAVKTGLQKYHNTCFSRSGVNLMWLLKKTQKLAGDFKF